MSGNFVIYLIGYVIVVIGVAYGMSAAGLGTQWIVPAVLILAGLGIVYALSRSQRDQSTGAGTRPANQNTQSQSPPQNQGETSASGQGQTSQGSAPRDSGT